MSDVLTRLHQLLDAGRTLKGDDRRNTAKWRAETLRLIDALLGPSPINIHSEGYYEFQSAESHEEKVAILNAILISYTGGSPSFRPSTEPIADVFLVHGQDVAARESVARFLQNLGLSVVLLSEVASSNLTIAEKLERYANVRFAVVLLTPDDKGGPAHAMPASYSLRARQNVILELGYFMGRLGRERVCTLYKEGVETPSDYHGVVYVPMDLAGAWKLGLAKELKASGLAVDLSRVV